MIWVEQQKREKMDNNKIYYSNGNLGLSFSSSRSLLCLIIQNAITSVAFVNKNVLRLQTTPITAKLFQPITLLIIINRKISWSRDFVLVTSLNSSNYTTNCTIYLVKSLPNYKKKMWLVYDLYSIYLSFAITSTHWPASIDWKLNRSTI